MISFWAEWSQPSVQMNAVVDQLSKLHSQITFVKVPSVLHHCQRICTTPHDEIEAEEVSEVSEKFEVETVPTVLFLKVRPCCSQFSP